MRCSEDREMNLVYMLSLEEQRSGREKGLESIRDWEGEMGRNQGIVATIN